MSIATQFAPAPSVASLTPVERVTLAAEILERIQLVREQFQRETGRKLDTDQAIREWAHRETEGVPIDGDAHLEPADLEPVACELACRGYSREAIAGALADIGRTGTAECSANIDDEDRPSIEALIPEAPEDAWKGPRRKGVLWGRMVAR